MEPIKIAIPNELFSPAEMAHFEGEADLGVLKAGPDLYTFTVPRAWSVQGKAGRVETGRGWVRRGEAGPGGARRGEARCGGAR